MPDAKPSTEICCVYWLFDETCSVPENDGYIGITNNPRQRRAEHRSLNKLRWTGFKILFVGTRDECLERELGYRPHPGIGWNCNSGGGSGKTFAKETRRKISENQKWRRASEATKAKMRAAHANRSPELRAMYRALAKGNKSRTGQKASAEERAKQSKARLGNKNAVGNKNRVGKKHSDESIRLMSEAKKGNKYRIGAKHSDETKAKMSASQKSRLSKEEYIKWRKG
jgi:hypothetical protein